MIETRYLLFSNAKKDDIVLDKYIFSDKSTENLQMVFLYYTLWNVTRVTSGRPNAGKKRTFDKNSLFHGKMLICSMHASQIERYDTTFPYVVAKFPISVE